MSKSRKFKLSDDPDYRRQYDDIVKSVLKEPLRTLEQKYLSSPEKICHRLYDLDYTQKLTPSRKPNLLSLLGSTLSSTECSTELKFAIDPVTCRINPHSFYEVPIDLETKLLSSTNSIRTSAPTSTSGNDIDYDIKDLDFDNDFLCVPPGWKEGLTLEKKEQSANATSLAEELDSLSKQCDPTSELTPNDISKVVESTDLISDMDSTFKDILKVNRGRGVLNISETHSTSFEEGGKTDWAEIITERILPSSRFQKQVPNLAMEFAFGANNLDSFQKQAIMLLEERKNVFVAAHTSAGKTVVAEYAISLCKKYHNKAIYTSPIKALSNQKFRDFREKFGTDEVGLLTGDIRLKPEASCLIMTTEILRNMLYRGEDTIRELEWVIFDEVHYINDTERGVVWEEVLIMLPKHIRVVLLSATIPNAIEFADWVGRTRKSKVHVVRTYERPVPLEHFLYVPDSAVTAKSRCHSNSSSATSLGFFLFLNAKGAFLSNAFNDANVYASKQKQQTSIQKPNDNSSRGGHGGSPGRGGQSQNRLSSNKNASGKPQGYVKHETKEQVERRVWISLIRALQQLDRLPVVAFTLSRKRCDDNAKLLAALDLTSEWEKIEIDGYIKKYISKLKPDDQQLPQVIDLKKMLRRGVAVHHSGILPLLKEIVEILFADGYVKFLLATETFAMGVNMPAKTVAFDSMRKHDGKAFRDLLPGEYIQMAGRAGRRSLDKTGMVVVLCKHDIPEHQSVNAMTMGKPTRLDSKFRITYSMILNLLRGTHTLKIEELISRSFLELPQQKLKDDSFSEKVQKLEDQLERLDRLDCLVCNSDIYTYYRLNGAHLSQLSAVMAEMLVNPNITKLMAAGRVLIIDSGDICGPIPALVLSQPGHRNDPKWDCLTIKIQSVDNGVDSYSPNKQYIMANVTGLKCGEASVACYTPDFSQAFATAASLIQGGGKNNLNVVVALVTVDSNRVLSITNKTLKIKDGAVLKSQMKWTKGGDGTIEFNRDAKLSIELFTTIQDFCDLVTSFNSGDQRSTLRALDPIKDFSVNQISFVEKLAKARKDFESITACTSCWKCPEFTKHMALTTERIRIEEEIQQLKYRVSDASLQLLPEYKNKLQVLSLIKFIKDTTNASQIEANSPDEINTSNYMLEMKGQFACEMTQHELLLTELVLQNSFANLRPVEIAALLSCLVLQFRSMDVDEKKKMVKAQCLPDNLYEAAMAMFDRANALDEAQQHCDITMYIGDDLTSIEEQIHPELMEVVLRWAEGQSFVKVKELTDIQEGIIVRCIQRLDEMLKNLKVAAKVIGNVELGVKMDAASLAIRRDIVFAASLYTQ